MKWLERLERLLPFAFRRNGHQNEEPQLSVVASPVAETEIQVGPTVATEAVVLPPLVQLEPIVATKPSTVVAELEPEKVPLPTSPRRRRIPNRCIDCHWLLEEYPRVTRVASEEARYESSFVLSVAWKLLQHGVVGDLRELSDLDRLRVGFAGLYFLDSQIPRSAYRNCDENAFATHMALLAWSISVPELRPLIHVEEAHVHGGSCSRVRFTDPESSRSLETAIPTAVF